jgi:hypothetical protein
MLQPLPNAKNHTPWQPLLESQHAFGSYSKHCPTAVSSQTNNQPHQYIWAYAGHPDRTGWPIGSAGKNRVCCLKDTIQVPPPPAQDGLHNHPQGQESALQTVVV